MTPPKPLSSSRLSQAEGRDSLGAKKMAGGPFRWEHICMVINVILLYRSCPLFAMPPPSRPLIATNPPSRLRTHAALQSAFMPVDFRRFWCHNEGGWRFDTAPPEFHAPRVSMWLRRSAGRYSRNWSFIAFARGDYQPPSKARAGSAWAADPFAPLNPGATFLTPSNLKAQLKPC